MTDSEVMKEMIKGGYANEDGSLVEAESIETDSNGHSGRPGVWSEGEFHDYEWMKLMCAYIEMKSNVKHDLPEKAG